MWPVGYVAPKLLSRSEWEVGLLDRTHKENSCKRKVIVCRVTTINGLAPSAARNQCIHFRSIQIQFPLKVNK